MMMIVMSWQWWYGNSLLTGNLRLDSLHEAGGVEGGDDGSADQLEESFKSVDQWEESIRTVDQWEESISRPVLPYTLEHQVLAEHLEAGASVHLLGPGCHLAQAVLHPQAQALDGQRAANTWDSQD